MKVKKCKICHKILNGYGGEGGIRTLDGLLTHTPLAGERLQPLGHLSGLNELFFILTGALGGIRTPDRLVRSQELCPTELPAQKMYYHRGITCRQLDVPVIDPRDNNRTTQS